MMPSLVVDYILVRFVGAQSFRSSHRGRVCVRVFIGVSSQNNFMNSRLF
jgi:hypothetical protein